MRSIRRILVAVKDPTAKSMPAVAKAAQLAKAFNAEIELFHSLAHTVFVDALAAQNINLRDYEREQRTKLLAQLEAVAAQLRKHRLKVSTFDEWDYPIHEAIVRRGARTKADLIVVERHAGARHAKWLLTYTDWEVLRLAPCPVLIVKTPKPYHRPALLAAIDPAHAFAKPAKLDNEILRFAEAFRSKLHGRLHVVHAYATPLVVVGGFAAEGSRFPTDVTAGIQDEAKENVREEVHRLGLASVTQHVIEGPADVVIPEVANKTKSAIVVMGAISRSGLKRLFIGNTAEQVVDKLTSDVLVIKPANFELRVKRTVRGMSVMTAPLMP